MRRETGNPVYKREMTVRSRNLRAPFILLIFNGILAAVSLINIYMAVSRAKVSASVQYSSFIGLYGFVTTLEFFLLVILTPALTAGSISGEREKGTLELLLTTEMSPADIVIGKLMSAFSQIAVLIVSSLPMIFITFVYGSVRIRDLAALIVCFAVTAAFTGTAGIFFSALMKRSTISNVCTYLTLAAVMAGTVILSLSGSGRGMRGPDGAVYILLINPVITFASILSGQTAGTGGISALAALTAGTASDFMAEYWVPASLAIQTVLALLFAWGAIIFADPKRHSKNTRRR